MAAYGEALRGRAWTDERVDLLKKLWTEGLSASQIAGRLGGVTRNSVISKIHRLGLSGRVTPNRTVMPKKPRAQRPNVNGGKSRSVRLQPSKLASLLDLANEPFKPATHEELDIPLAERRTIETLTECNCRWPIGDPQEADFHFCNRKKVMGFPYCEFHARRAFQPRSGPPKPVIDIGWNHKRVLIAPEPQLA